MDANNQYMHQNPLRASKNQLNGVCHNNFIPSLTWTVFFAFAIFLGANFEKCLILGDMSFTRWMVPAFKLGKNYSTDILSKLYKDYLGNLQGFRIWGVSKTPGSYSLATPHTQRRKSELERTSESTPF